MSHSLITQHLDLWTGAVTRKTNGRGRQPANGQAGGSYELTGIQKLRELILELAVRGKLVPQDPEDEPASELLKRIEEEKQRMVDEGNIKKPKKLPEVTEEEKPFEVPEGWEWCRLNEVCEYIQRGKGPKYAEKGMVKVLSQKCVQWSGLDLSPARFVADSTLDNYKSERFIQAKDILWNSTGTGTVGRLVVVDEDSLPDYPLVADSHVTIVRLLPINQDFIYRYLASPVVQSRIEPKHENSLVSGTTKQVELNTSSVKPLPVPIPPLEEQHRIAQKVDELMALCDRLEQQTADQLAAHETLVDTLLDTLTRSADAAELAENWSRLEAHFDTLFTTEHSIDRLKETILQLAVMGKLVPQDPDEEPASELLKRIEEEKQRLVDEGKIKKPKKLPEVAEEEKPFEVPEGWELITLSHLGSFSGGKTPSKNKPIYWDGDIPWVTPKDMKNAKVQQSEDHVTQIAVDEGLELFPERTIFFVVRSGILRRMFPVAINSMPCTINQDLKGLKLFDDSIAEYIQLMMLGFESYILENLTKTGTTVESLKFDEFTKQPFPIPPLEEQHRIVRKVDELMVLCDRLKERLAEVGELRVQLAETIVEDGVG